jgi:hypothetical protein
MEEDENKTWPNHWIQRLELFQATKATIESLSHDWTLTASVQEGRRGAHPTNNCRPHHHHHYHHQEMLRMISITGSTSSP